MEPLPRRGFFLIILGLPAMAVGCDDVPRMVWQDIALEQSSAVHVRFLPSEQAFRVCYRRDGRWVNKV